MEESDYALDNLCCAVDFMASRNGEQLHVGRVHPLTSCSSTGRARLPVDNGPARSDLNEDKTGETKHSSGFDAGFWFDRPGQQLC